jgi:hypothetical protein
MKVAPLTMLNRAWDYIYGTFRMRNYLRWSVVGMSVVMGPFLFFLPSLARFYLAYVYVGAFSLLGFFTYGTFRGLLKALIGSVFLGWKYKPRELIPEEYRAYGFKQIMNEMGIRKRVRVFITSNPLIESPFTNAFTNKVYIPESWRAEFHQRDLRGVLGHELGHLKTIRKFERDFLMGLGAVAGATFALGLFSIPVVTTIFEFALAFLMLTAVAWRNEFRADLEGAKMTGPEALISVFDQLLAKSKRDEGSETHPPLRQRIARLAAMLNSVSPPGTRT